MLADDTEVVNTAIAKCLSLFFSWCSAVMCIHKYSSSTLFNAPHDLDDFLPDFILPANTDVNLHTSIHPIFHATFSSSPECSCYCVILTLLTTFK